MAGIINQAQAAQPVDPQVVERVVMAATTAINNPQIESQILQIVKSSPNPAQGLAQAGMMVMKILVEKSKGMPPQAFLPASGKVLGLIAKMCVAAKVLQPSPQLIEQALQVFLQLVKQQATTEQAAQPAAPEQPTPAAAPVAAPAPQGV